MSNGNRSLFGRICKSLWKVFANLTLFVLAFICGFFEVIFFYIKRGKKVPNYHHVDTILYRGGQPSKAGFKELSDIGIKTIINLRVGDFTRKVIEEYYDDEMRVIHLPFYPYDPQDRIIIEFLKILITSPSLPAFVHCFHGADRTGTVCAIYRIVMQGWEKEKAISEMKEKGLHFWHKNLIHYITNLDVDFIRREIGLF